MSIFETEALKMDAVVDEVLGDTICYSTDGGATFTEYSGFVIHFDQGLGLEAIDEVLGSAKRVKLAKALIPLPLPAHRITAARLGEGTFRPMAKQVDNEGRYYVFDVQKV